jgi:hypothetical protein
MKTIADKFEAEALSIWDGPLHDQYDVLSNANTLATQIYSATPTIHINNGEEIGTIYCFPDGSIRFVSTEGGEIHQWEV